ncbi:MAG: site-specific recombinase, phage integrase family [uncultured Sulfurovum sp.]|uniref:Site-specific recombinase, phage integrase family n=1 Tax=uncultured Sulfurovum sp. TaxID=269237 RepID=A0A6S6T273_9BACT|nr:MAG: site-specific recombinase, phage integrase family [uncultured Sulfurovum sp.]
MAEYIKSKKYTGVIYNLLKNKDRSYYIFYKVNGKTYRVHIGKKSEGITEAYCHQKRNDAINKLKFGDTDSIIKTKVKVDTFDVITQRYLEYFQIHNRDSLNHESRYRNHIQPFIGDKSVTDITVADLENIQREKLKKLSPQTVNHIIQLIGTIFNYNILHKYIKVENPVQRTKLLKVNNERQRYLETDEIETLFDVVKNDKQLLLFTKLALHTGARLHTLCNIKKKDINLEKQTVFLQDYKNGTFYTSFLSGDIIKLLKTRLRQIKSQDFILLFGTDPNNIDTYISKKLRPILNNLFNTELERNDRQNRVVIHSLRHTFASHLAINGTPIYTIQKLMNHKDINMTLRYAKLAPDSGKEFIENLYV